MVRSTYALVISIFHPYIGCIKEISRKNYATYEIKEYGFAIFEYQCKMFIAKHIANPY